MLKTKSFLILIKILFIGALILIPVFVYAQGWQDYVPIDLRVTNINTLISNIIQILLIIAGVVALIYLIWAGYMYITAAGNAEQAAAARSTILNALIGLVLVFASYAILIWIMRKYLENI